MLTMKAKYALRALAVLATHPGEALPAHTLAREARVPARFLEAILADLGRAGFLTSRRGANGGHTLARAAAEIPLGAVIRAIDGPLAPIPCASVSAYRPCADCPDPDRCSVRRVMSEVRAAIAGVLDARSLSDQVVLGVAAL